MWSALPLLPVSGWRAQGTVSLRASVAEQNGMTPGNRRQDVPSVRLENSSHCALWFAYMVLAGFT